MFMKNVWFFIDDSGVLHKNAPNKFFVYAGYSFIDYEKKRRCKASLSIYGKKIRDGAKIDGEVKACKLQPKYKGKLYSVMKNEKSVAATVNIDQVYNNILGDKNSIHRYKDYVLKRLIKKQIQDYIFDGYFKATDDLHVIVYLDEQATATNGIYNLRDSIYEELAEGIANFDYGTFHKPVMQSNVQVDVLFCDSSKNYLIQSADILANRIWCSYILSKPTLRKLSNHVSLQLP